VGPGAATKICLPIPAEKNLRGLMTGWAELKAQDLVDGSEL